jgi:hypothetical protein
MSMTKKKLNTVKPALVTSSIKQKLVLCDLNLYFPSQCVSYHLNLLSHVKIKSKEEGTENTVVSKSPSHRVLGHCINQELLNLSSVTSEIWSHKASGHLIQV